MSDNDDKKNEIKVVGLDLVASQEQAIANITEVEPEYMEYFDNLAPEKQKKIPVKACLHFGLA